MGYFPNGTAGMIFEEEWCDKCLHQCDCAVWDAHMFKNYEECNKEDSILHWLITKTKEDSAKECKMFVDKTLLSPLALAKWNADHALND